MSDEGQVAETRQQPDMGEGAGVALRDYLPARRPTPVALAFTQGNALLFPDRRTAPSRRRTMLALYRGVTRQALQHWMAGRRRAPQWAIALLIGEIKKRIAALEHVLALLQAHESER